MKTIPIRLPKLHNTQSRIIREKKRFNVVALGRRSGKSVLGIDRLINAAIAGKPVSWFAPNYRMLDEVWRSVKALTLPVTSSISVQNRRIELITQGVIDFWSLDNPDAPRGRKYAVAVIDEAAMIKDLLSVWNEVIRPLLADYRGECWFLSTPKGKDGFWTLYNYGLDPEQEDWQCWQLPTSCNPFIDSSEIESMRQGMPERSFQQEILAQFIEDGSVFRNVRECLNDERDIIIQRYYGHRYIIGADWAGNTGQSDYTAFALIDATDRRVVKVERFNGTSFELQRFRLLTLYNEWLPEAIYVEANSIGAPMIEELCKLDLPIVPIVTTNASKADMVNKLALAFEKKTITLPNDPVLLHELTAFESTRLSSGLYRYAAPSGSHDDTVMALLIGWQGVYDGDLLFGNW